MAAWTRLWTKLLAPPTTTAATGRPNEGQASVRRLNERVGCQENENDRNNKTPGGVAEEPYEHMS
jgi:hypothetical protein